LLYLFGRIYDWSIELILRKMKQGIARYVSEHNLSPTLDICCGTGRQGHLIGINKQNIIGLDRDLKMVQYAQSKYPSIPLICADAADIPLKNGYFKGIIISYSLHDKPPELRTKMLSEAKRLLAPEGKMILVDFEQPWNKWSRLAGIFTYLIERMAGREHFRNGRQFLKQGGLRALIKLNGIVEIERYDIELGNSSMVIAQFAGKVLLKNEF